MQNKPQCNDRTRKNFYSYISYCTEQQLTMTQGKEYVIGFFVDNWTRGNLQRKNVTRPIFKYLSSLEVEDNKDVK
ncbi:hypothetical protein MTR_4g104055 [Medicago truncatula]|uniref:Uncharacterized protein n=1 Tax=Medicago truncatula TaxID=3880 RepID=A0A072V0S3_MEDTR|nr:hypothetical protein MTR_4g104055 [Medicago truncatula]